MKENQPTARRYDRECKENAVALVRGGRTITSVARDLGVTTWSLARWVQMAKAGQGQREPKPLTTETGEARAMRRLRQENDCLRQQRDLLEKSVGHLVSGSASTRHTLTTTMQHEHPVAAWAEALEVSASGSPRINKRRRADASGRTTSCAAPSGRSLRRVARPTAARA